MASCRSQDTSTAAERPRCVSTTRSPVLAWLSEVRTSSESRRLASVIGTWNVGHLLALAEQGVQLGIADHLVRPVVLVQLGYQVGALRQAQLVLSGRRVGNRRVVAVLG